MTKIYTDTAKGQVSLNMFTRSMCEEILPHENVLHLMHKYLGLVDQSKINQGTYIPVTFNKTLTGYSLAVRKYGQENYNIYLKYGDVNQAKVPWKIDVKKQSGTSYEFGSKIYNSSNPPK